MPALRKRLVSKFELDDDEKSLAFPFFDGKQLIWFSFRYSSFRGDFDRT